MQNNANNNSLQRSAAIEKNKSIQTQHINQHQTFQSNVNHWTNSINEYQHYLNNNNNNSNSNMFPILLQINNLQQLSIQILQQITEIKGKIENLEKKN